MKPALPGYSLLMLLAPVTPLLGQSLVPAVQFEPPVPLVAVTQERTASTQSVTPQATVSFLPEAAQSAALGMSSSPCDSGCRSSLWTRPTLTGDWNGLRPSLAESGFTFGGRLTQFGFGVSGGVERLPAAVVGPLAFDPNDTFKYTAHGEYETILNLEKLVGLEKGSLLIRAEHWFGQYGNVSFNTGAFTPAVFPAALPPRPNDPGQLFLTNFVWTQPLSKNLVVFAGKKDVLGTVDQDEFAGGDGTYQFMNQAFVANPAFLLALPYTSFTAGFVSPQQWGGFSAYVYDPQDRTGEVFQVNDLFSKGVIVGGEVKLKTNFFSLPGEQHVGGVWKHLDLPDLAFSSPPSGEYPYAPTGVLNTISNSYTIYYGFDQYFQVYSEESKRGWGMFSRFSVSDGNPTPLRYFFSAGLGGYSPFNWCRGDSFGIGWYYVDTDSKQFGAVPTALFGPRDGWGLECYYNFQVTPWLNVSPDFQVIKPGLGAIADTAILGGLRVNLTF